MRTLPLLTTLLTALGSCEPIVSDVTSNVTYRGFLRNGVEVFLGVPYGDDTGGVNRFKPPTMYLPKNGSTINATAYGPACPQPLGRPGLFPLYISNVTEISENCLNLNIVRPNGTDDGSKLPVMVWIHGGSFWSGFNGDIANAPDAMILQSMDNQLPVIHVAINYRLGAFGFAQNQALREQVSLNAGLRDQRLAIEWTRDNIAMFGGDPEHITIGGQSSGGLAVGMQIMAFGATKPVPFQQAVCESQALEPGITDSNDTISCLRGLSTDALLNASIATYSGDISNNIGDCWLPVVDGDFLPDSPSNLVTQHRMANITAIIGWCEDDVGFFTPRTITSDNDTHSFIASYLPDFNDTTISKLLSLYPTADFSADPSANLTANFYRSARMFRDILMTCMPSWMGSNLAAMGASVFLYDQNATILTPLLDDIGATGLGPVHTSEFAYVFGNLSHYNLTADGLPGFDPTEEDYELAMLETRSWSSFIATGQPSLSSKDTLQGWGLAFAKGGGNGEQDPMATEQTNVYVVGGGQPGLSSISNIAAGQGATNQALLSQKLQERCAFLNSPDIIQQMRF